VIATYLEPKTHQKFVDEVARRGLEEPIRAWATLSPDERAQVTILFGWKIPQSVIDQCPRLRWIQGAGAGVDWLLPLMIPSTVTISRIVDQFGPDMAEFALLGALAWVKNWPRIHTAQRRHQWDPFLVGRLADKVVGVLGAGSIGETIAGRFRPWVDEVRALGRHRPRLPEIVGYSIAEQAAFFTDLDLLIMVLPLTPETRHMVGAEALSRMKAGGYVINLGRGAVLDTKALVSAVRSGQLSGALLDVHEDEPLPSDSELWDLPGVTISPHISGPSRVEGMADVFVDNYRRFVAGEALRGVVDRVRGY